ncbi:MAG: cyclase family protein [Clostridia bacterium]|nr:cyclase family protein [Clostridia bacterium]
MLNAKNIYDITRPLHNSLTVWPGDDGVTLERALSMGDGAMCNVSRVEMGVHSGTHMDAPLHFVDGGADISTMPMACMMGEVLVVETSEDAIEALIIADLDYSGINAVFFKTLCSDRNEAEPFLDRYPAITEGCAAFLVEKGIKTVGTDYLSIEYCTDNTFSVHKKLLSNNIAIVENLCLKGIAPGRYGFICLPLKMKGADGSPCRALLFR